MNGWSCRCIRFDGCSDCGWNGPECGCSRRDWSSTPWDERWVFHPPPPGWSTAHPPAPHPPKCGWCIRPPLRWVAMEDSISTRRRLRPASSWCHAVRMGRRPASGCWRKGWRRWKFRRWRRGSARSGGRRCAPSIPAPPVRHPCTGCASTCAQ